MDNYDVENTFQNEMFKQKSKQTCLEKYGVENPAKSELFKQKSKQTCLEKYGVEYYFQTEDKKNKSKQTCLEKYGVENPMQNKEIFGKMKKSSFSTTKEYKFETGEIKLVQGYEPFALKILEEQGYKYNDIKIEGVEIKYSFDNNSNRVHRPDIYIPKENRIIEVKSLRTYNLHLEQNIVKQKSSIEQGFIYEYWIFDHKGKMLI